MSTETVYPGASADDGYGYAGYSSGLPVTVYSNSDSVISIGEVYVPAPPPTALLFTGVMRFLSVSAGPGDTINSATFNFYVVTAAAATNIRLYGHDAYNPTMPTTYAQYTTFIGNKTTAYVAPASSYFSSTGWKSFSITSIVQEIIDRGDWVAGGALGLIFGQYGSVPENYNPALRSYNYGSLYPYIDITWTPSYIPLAASGYIGMGGATADRSINIRLGKAESALISLNDSDARTLAGKPSGVISIDDFHGK